MWKLTMVATSLVWSEAEVTAHQPRVRRRKRSLNLLTAALIAALGAGSACVSAPPGAEVRARAAATELDEAPPPAPRQLAPLVGFYGAPEHFVNVYEAGGQLYVDGLGLTQAPLRQTGRHRYAAIAEHGAKLQFQLDGAGRTSGLTLGSEPLARRDFGAEVEAEIRAAVRVDADGARRAALAATPPREPPAPRQAELVDLAIIDPAIRFDIRYAGVNNFMGLPLYERPGAYLQRPAAEALGRVSRALAARGYGLLIHDAYRPWFVTKMFWEATPPQMRPFVADPQQGSRHNRGSAVDLTLYALETGRAVEMPGRYDEMSIRSYPDFIGGTSQQRWLRQLLRREMEREGFIQHPSEWWHFDHRDWSEYGIGTATFTELAHPGN